ncbi:histidinol-phosphatase HisJ [Cellulosilyticum ruminicola]|uniref:histidinol-phosphatase HisJ n=1 Tax=Cellulosilyticum ruminicola TaxID=425254 RepID=UPI0006D0734F|nr:histidinol-phosphatase HisJ [Cellulosilyticum ruminicola]
MLNLNEKKDGHIHTPFCPHGTKDCFEQYVYEAIKRGREEMSFTEHFPMPRGVTSDAYYNECVIREEQIEEYVEAVRKIKEQFKGQIKINVGFEIDYIEGKEKEIKALLEKYGDVIEDSLLSIHFVKLGDRYYAIDDLDEFGMLLDKVGSIECVYDLYYETLLKSVQSDLGRYKPRRIGHPTLVRIFNQKYPCEYTNDGLLEEIVQAIKEKDYEVDYNVAGLRKKYCKEVYPTGKMLTLLEYNDIPLVYGTDAHQSEEIKS